MTESYSPSTHPRFRDADDMLPLTPSPSPARGEGEKFTEERFSSSPLSPRGRGVGGEGPAGRCPRIAHTYLAALCFIALFASSDQVRAGETIWKAGAAKAVITPKSPLWMAGYASRTSPANGTLHELYVRVLALEDAAGHRAVLVSTDLLGIPRSISENVTRTLQEKFGLPREAVMLNASHTHSGPVLRGALYDAYPLDEAAKKKIDAYSSELEAAMVRTVGQALAHLVPAQVSVGVGVTDFAVNRRNNREPDVPALIASHALRG